MRAMVLVRPGEPLQARDVAVPVPGSGQVQVRVRACGVCRTDLHVADGELTHPALPLILGHEIVGEVAALGSGVSGVSLGERVGVPWLGWTCGECRFCASGRENLCERARFTGYTLNGGYAEYALADARFCFPLPDGDAVAQAPLLCAGLIGFRALALAGDARRIGLYGFGASAHLLAQVARHQGR
ncbi:MAG TPA: alcohol dehydrogenase catalytic domain-containing protein, partial [Myxococcaceae bacterium]|nr:alcohol dehydrogenase catalytic domain-containing protein [Myxococcaceae bacterium]